MRKILKAAAAAAVAALLTVCASVTTFAEASKANEEAPQTTREEQFWNCVYNELYSVYPQPKEQLRISQPFPIYKWDGTLSNRYHCFIFDGDKIYSNLELFEDEKGLRMYSYGGKAYEEAEKAYADGTKIGLVMRKDEIVYMTTKNSRILLAYPSKTEEKAAPKFVKLEKIQLTDVNIPENYYDKKWEEELIYYSKYRKHKDEDFYEESIVKAGGPREWWLSYEDADLFRNAEKQVIQLKYEDLEESEQREDKGRKASVKINLYLSHTDCYTYTIDLNERFCASIPEILEETGLLENDKYKDIIGIIIESDSGYDYDSLPGRCMTGYEFSPMGWLINGNNVYYVKKDLTLAKGSYLISGTRYYFDENGVWQGLYTGWTKANGKPKYWVNGILMRCRLFDADGNRWRADENGYVTLYEQ